MEERTEAARLISHLPLDQGSGAHIDVSFHADSLDELIAAVKKLREGCGECILHVKAVVG